jgi:hypothetical protein
MHAQLVQDVRNVVDGGLFSDDKLLGDRLQISICAGTGSARLQACIEFGLEGFLNVLVLNIE